MNYFIINFLSLSLYQKVEEETSSAVEQLVSNRLSALHCNLVKRMASAVLLFVTGIALSLIKYRTIKTAFYQ